MIFKDEPKRHEELLGCFMIKECRCDRSHSV